MFGNMGRIWGEIDLDTTRMDMGVAKASASMKGLQAQTGSVASAFKGAAVGIGLVGGAIAVAAIKMAADFDTNMRKVWSLTEESQATFERWKDQVKELSRDLPQDASAMAEAFYWIKSDMPDATDAQQLQTLEIAARGAVGGVAELADTTEALVQVQNAYKDINPAKYMDLMNLAVERGSITLQDFVANQGKVVGAAALAKVPFEEITSAIAVLTRNAVPADTAFMALNQTIMGFLKPTDEASQIASQYGIDLSLATLQSQGLAGALLEIGQKIPDDELAELFPNVRALKAVFPLAATAADEFAKELENAGNASGTSARMFEVNSQSIENKFKTALGKLKLVLIDLGEKLLPMVSKALDAFGRILDGQNEAFNSFAGIVRSVAGALWDLAGIIVRCTPLLVGLVSGFLAFKAVGFVSSLMASIGTAVGALPGVFSWLGGAIGVSSVSLAGLAGPIGIAVAAAAGLGIGIWKIVDAMNAHHEAAAKINEAAIPYAQKMEELKTTLLDTSTSQEQYNQALADFDDNMQKAAEASPAFIDQIDAQGKVIKYASDQLLLYEAMVGRRSEAMNESVQAGEREAETMSDLIEAYNSEQIALENAEASRRGLMEHRGEVYKPVDIGGGVMQNQLVKDMDAWQDQMDKTIVNAKNASTQMNLLRGDINGMVNSAATDFYRLGQSSTSMSDAMNAGLSQILLQLSNADPLIRERARNMLGSFAAGWGESRGWTELQITDFVTHLSTLMTLPNMGVLGSKATMDFLGGLMANKDITWEQVNGLVVGIEEQLRALNAGQISQTQFEEYVSGLLVGMGKAPEEAAAIVEELVASLQGADAASQAGSEAGKAWDMKMAEGITSGQDTVQKATNDMVNGVNIPKKQLLIEPKLTQQELNLKVNVEPGKKESPFVPMPAEEIGRYIARNVQKGYEAEQPTLEAAVVPRGVSGASSAVTGGGVGDTDLGPLTDDIALLEKMWAALNQTALVGWSNSVDAVQFGQIEQAIADLGKEIAGPQLEAWRNMRQAYDGAKAELEKYSQAISDAQKQQDMIQNSTRGWTDSHGRVHESLTRLQEKLAVVNQRINDVRSSTDGWTDANGRAHKSLQTLQQMKLVGEGAASDKSFGQQQQLNKLELERLQITAKGVANMTAADFTRLMEIDKLKEQLMLQKQIDDLQTSVTYDPQRRGIEKLLDPLKGQEMTQAQITAEIKAAQTEIAKQEASQKVITQEIAIGEAELKKQRDRLWELREQYDACTKAVQDYEQMINKMAQNFLQHYQEMIRAQEELNRQMAAGGGGVPGYASGGPVYRTGLALLHAGEYVLPRNVVQALGGRVPSQVFKSSTDNSRRMQVFHFDKLILPNVRDYGDLKRELSNARLRPQVS